MSFLSLKNIFILIDLYFSELWDLSKFSLKKVAKIFGGIRKSLYLCTRFWDGGPA